MEGEELIEKVIERLRSEKLLNKNRNIIWNYVPSSYFKETQKSVAGQLEIKKNRVSEDETDTGVFITGKNEYRPKNPSLPSYLQGVFFPIGRSGSLYVRLDDLYFDIDDMTPEKYIRKIEKIEAEIKSEATKTS